MLRAARQLLAIPDVDHYSDEQYERLIIQAKLRRGDAIWVLPLAAGILAALIWTGVAIGIDTVLSKTASPALVGVASSRWYLLNGVVMLTIFLAAYFGVRWIMIVRSIRNILNRAGCPFCEFSLVGLRIQFGKVTCPECGSAVFLHEHRLNPDDLIPETQRRTPFEGAGPSGAYSPQSAAKTPSKQHASSRR